MPSTKRPHRQAGVRPRPRKAGDRGAQMVAVGKARAATASWRSTGKKLGVLDTIGRAPLIARARAVSRSQFVLGN
jgi:hypothetical protein